MLIILIVSFVSHSSELVSGGSNRALQLTARRVVDNDDVCPALRLSNRGYRCWKIEERWERRHDARAMDALPHAQCRQTAGTRSVGDDLAGRAPCQHDEHIDTVVDEGTCCNVGQTIILVIRCIVTMSARISQINLNTERCAIAECLL